MSEYQSETNRTQTRPKKGVDPQDPEEGKNATGSVDSDSVSDLKTESGAAKPEKPTPKSSRHRHRHHEHAGKDRKSKKETENVPASTTSSAADPPKAEEEEREEAEDDAEDSDLDLDADSTRDVSLLEVFQNSDPKQLDRLFSCLSLSHTHTYA